MSERFIARARAPWPVCTVCGLAAPDVRGDPLRCVDPKRCVRVGVDFQAHVQGVLFPTPEYYGDEPPAPNFQGVKPPREGDEAAPSGYIGPDGSCPL